MFYLGLVAEVNAIGLSHSLNLYCPSPKAPDKLNAVGLLGARWHKVEILDILAGTVMEFIRKVEADLTAPLVGYLQPYSTITSTTCAMLFPIPWIFHSGSTG